MTSGTIATQVAPIPVRLSMDNHRLLSSLFEASPPSALVYLLPAHSQPHQQIWKTEQIWAHRTWTPTQATSVTDHKSIHPLANYPQLCQLPPKMNKIRIHAGPDVVADVLTPEDRNDCTILRRKHRRSRYPRPKSSRASFGWIPSTYHLSPTTTIPIHIFPQFSRLIPPCHCTAINLPSCTIAIFAIHQIWYCHLHPLNSSFSVFDSVFGLFLYVSHFPEHYKIGFGRLAIFFYCSLFIVRNANMGSLFFGVFRSLLI